MSNSINNNGTNRTSLNQFANIDSQNQNPTFSGFQTKSAHKTNKNIPASTQASVNDQEIANRSVTTTKKQIITTYMTKGNSAEADLDATNNNCNTVKGLKEQINLHLEQNKKKLSSDILTISCLALAYLASILADLVIFIPLGVNVSILFLIPLFLLPIITGSITAVLMKPTKKQIPNNAIDYLSTLFISDAFRNNLGTLNDNINLSIDKLLNILSKEVKDSYSGTHEEKMLMAISINLLYGKGVPNREEQHSFYSFYVFLFNKLKPTLEDANINPQQIAKMEEKLNTKAKLTKPTSSDSNECIQIL